MNKDDLLICAFRYCLGRMTYVVSDMSHHIEKEWKTICEPFQKLIEREIRYSLKMNAAGMQEDRESWEKLLKFIEESNVTS